MSIERATFDGITWDVYWTAPGLRSGRIGTPIASFTATQSDPQSPVIFDASASFETSGSIVSYTWNFGDGSKLVTASTPTTSRRYVKPGSYTVLLVVTDGTGNKAESQHLVAVRVDTAPSAAFIADVAGMSVSLNAQDSSDADGTIVSYAWDFGDGAIGSGVAPNHTYEFGGEYQITLMVTDDQGVSTSTSDTVVVAPAPDAEFTFNVNALVVTVNAQESSDFNPIAQYTWYWGEVGSSNSHGITAKHTYANAGTYPIALEIKDAAGNTDVVTHEVAVAPIFVPEPPKVNFSTTTTNLKASFNASASTSSDSTLVGFDWTFGDTHTGTGVTTSHTYSSGGSYSVQLTVTDQLGLTATKSKSVTVSPPYVPPPPPPPGSGGPPPPGHETTTWPYQIMNRRQVISDDDYDPDISWEHHQQRGSLGGVDHNAPYGTPLYANCTGRAYTIPLSEGGTGGRTINLYLGSTGWYDQYMHLSSFAISNGQHVKQGQLIGHSGASGDGSDYFYAPHFHLHRYTPSGVRVNAYHYFCGSGTRDSRNDEPGQIVVTLQTGVPNITFWRNLQWYAKSHGYAYPCDGYMSIPAWKGVQRGMSYHGYNGAIDGSPGSATYKALQRIAHDHGSTSAIDGTLSTADYRALSKWLNGD